MLGFDVMSFTLRDGCITHLFQTRDRRLKKSARLILCVNARATAGTKVFLTPGLHAFTWDTEHLYPMSTMPLMLAESREHGGDPAWLVRWGRQTSDQAIGTVPSTARRHRPHGGTWKRTSQLTVFLGKATPPKP